jgi:hypothetical protein
VVFVISHPLEGSIDCRALPGGELPANGLGNELVPAADLSFTNQLVDIVQEVGRQRDGSTA